VEQYDSAIYGERIADVYDELYSWYEEAAVAGLAELARGGRALELGIGTGRIALPLAARGIEVHGIDASPATVSRLKRKLGGADILVTLGDVRELHVSTTFALVYVVFNTFFGLLTQEDQVTCFESVAHCLEPGGVFLIEAFVPDMGRFSQDQTTRTVSVTDDHVSLECTRHDPVLQQCVTQHVFLREGGVRLYPVRIRYAWPSELDLMARIAGLRLRHRWGGWQGEPFAASSQRHISVYERPAVGGT